MKKLKTRHIIFIFLLFLLFIFIIRQVFISNENQKNDYFSYYKNTSDIEKSISNISEKLHNKKYGLKGGHWGEFLAHTFYGYSLVNLSLENKEDNEIREFAIVELKFILEYINSEGKNAFLNKKTDIPLGIIYNGHKNQILAGLVLLGEDFYKEELYKNSDYIFLYLNKNISKNSETYGKWSWYVDNVNAIFSLHITDLLREKEGLNKKYTVLISEWIKYMKKNTGKYGVIYSEAETPNLKNNQARGPAISWLLSYLYEIDNILFEEQFKLYQKYFYNDFIGLSRDIPKGQDKINKIKAGPVIFGYSSSATILSLSLYKINNNEDVFYKNLQSIDFLFFYKDGEYVFGKSALLNSLILWGKTKSTWSDKI